MACSTTNKQISLDLEDLFLGGKSHKHVATKDAIQKNMHIYKKMICEIRDWIGMVSLVGDKNFHIRKEFNKYFNKLVLSNKVYCKKSLLVYVYRKMIEHGEIENIPVMWSLIQKRPARNLSGVTIITVLTSPTPDGQDFSCAHNCYYCPNEPGQPRSYLKQEPAVARANRNKFDPILQMEDRIRCLIVNGHEIDKLEIIIEGGTYTEYPPGYLERFHRDLVYCANTYFDKDTLKREPFDIETEVIINATARVRIIGICIETRPDCILVDGSAKTWLGRFRKWGVTRVQLGVQHTNNDILRKVNRGHTIEQAQKAIQILKDNCFKVDIHLMPDLPNSNPAADRQMFEYVFKTPHLQPDQVKIYPCEVTPWTVIKRWHDTGKYKPYAQTDERALLDVVKYGMEICPPWVRLPRVIRDIPLTYIEGGNKYPNLRQMLNAEMERDGKVSMDIRVRECGRNPQYKIEDAEYVTRKYRGNDGDDYFISLESQDRMCIFGFLRLRIPDTYDLTEFDVLKNKAFIRELHVYGNLVPVGYNKTNESQHRGVGKKLLKIAEEIATGRWCDGIVVISGIGVTKYYEKQGYMLENTYMVKHFNSYEWIETLLVVWYVILMLFYWGLMIHYIVNN
jgi:ELP3 family radical SAM enzyme/protein acetyltransferase